jgi:hypothetical protein
MCCQEKLLVIIVLVLVILFLYFRNKKELFTADDYMNQINKQMMKYDAKKMNDPSYNYNPVAPQCPENAEEIRSWDVNTKICRLNGESIDRKCPSGMKKEGEYCYLECDSGYLRGNGLCWKQ